ncbi:ClpP/crotonase-like domain-containing protein [Mycena leptocephala]|nr:ClpP/crotonase-like domain-containing protein [Mycena leptocephala]
MPCLGSRAAQTTPPHQHFASFSCCDCGTVSVLGTLQTSNSSGVLNVVINNTFSTINLFDFHVQSDLANLVETLQANDTDIRVVVFPAPTRSSSSPTSTLNTFSLGTFDPGFPDMVFPEALIWNITQLPQATIAAIEGRARGIGNEFLMACDMRFATTSPSVLLAQFETSLGLTLAQAARYVDARTAASIGWINRAFDTSKELHDYVQALAERIALFPAAAVTGTKAGINKLAGMPEVQAFLENFIVATNNQSIGPLELNYGKELFSLFNLTQVPRDYVLLQ